MKHGLNAAAAARIASILMAGLMSLSLACSKVQQDAPSAPPTAMPSTAPTATPLSVVVTLPATFESTAMPSVAPTATPSPLVGLWRFEQDDISLTLYLNEDGTYSLTSGDETVSGSYAVEGETLVFTNPDFGYAAGFVCGGETLTLYQDGFSELVFIKEGEG
ncbi:MAG TPA: hypothetical protein P5116_02820 [Eubacteriales bacterium]|nr:hypothetical protein [Eubacteriales bacterium]